MTAPYIPPKRKSLRDALVAANLGLTASPTKPDHTATPGYRPPPAPTMSAPTPRPRIPQRNELASALRGEPMGDTPMGLLNEMLNPVRQGAQARDLLGDAIQSLSRNRIARGVGQGALGLAAAVPGVPEEIVRAYSKAKDSLMGFGRVTKGFDELNYPQTSIVRVEFPDGDTFVDAVNGMNGPHALERAYRNWDGAKISVLRTARGKEASAEALRWMDENHPLTFPKLPER